MSFSLSEYIKIDVIGALPQTPLGKFTALSQTL